MLVVLFSGQPVRGVRVAGEEASLPALHPANPAIDIRTFAIHVFGDVGVREHVEAFLAQSLDDSGCDGWEYLNPTRSVAELAFRGDTKANIPIHDFMCHP